VKIIKCEYEVRYSFSYKDGVEIINTNDEPIITEIKLRAKRFGYDTLSVTKLETTWYEVD
jgi:hypothetical protein